MGMTYEKEFIEWLVLGWEGNKEEFEAYRQAALELYFQDFVVMYGDLKNRGYTEEEIDACLNVMKMALGI